MLSTGIMGDACKDYGAWLVDIIGGNYDILTVIRILEKIWDGPEGL